MANNIGPGRRMVRSKMYSKGHHGSKKLTKSRLQSAPGKKIYKGCFGYSL